MAESHVPPDFASVVGAMAAPLDDRALAAAVRTDAVHCGELYQLVPTISRYDGIVDPARFPEAALEVAHQVVNAARGDRGHAVRTLAARHPSWRRSLEHATVAMEILGSEDDVQSLPVAIGPACPDGRPRFIVGELMARGAFGTIMEGFDRERAMPGRARPDADVVIKVVRTEGAGAPWEREARGASAIDHPCGIQVRASGTIGDALGFVAFERVHGRSLVSMAAAGERLPSVRLISEMGQLCEAIAELHAAGFVHGDISPANVMVDSFGRLRLVDFGLSRPITPEDATADVIRTGELLQWIALGYVPKDPAATPSTTPGARGTVVRIGAECRRHPPSSDELARRLRAAEWSIDRTIVVASGIGVAALLWGSGYLLKVLAG